jgi:hypothetical protein
MMSLASYGLVALGLGMLALAVARALASNLSYPASRLMLTNLLRTNPNQAEAACRNMKGTLFEAIGAAMKIGAMCAGAGDLKVIASATLPGYDGAVTAIKGQWSMLLARAKLAGLAVTGGLGLAVSTHTMPIWLVVVLGIVGGAAAITLLVRKAEVERSLLRARAEILPEVDRAFAEGRYRMG